MQTDASVDDCECFEEITAAWEEYDRTRDVTAITDLPGGGCCHYAPWRVLRRRESGRRGVVRSVFSTPIVTDIHGYLLPGTV